MEMDPTLAKQIVFTPEAQQALKCGVDILASAVATTLGPKAATLRSIRSTVRPFCRPVAASISSVNERSDKWLCTAQSHFALGVVQTPTIKSAYR